MPLSVTLVDADNTIIPWPENVTASSRVCRLSGKGARGRSQ